MWDERMHVRPWLHNYFLGFSTGCINSQCPDFIHVLPMTTSSTGNIFRVTGSLCGNSLMLCLICAWINGWWTIVRLVVWDAIAPIMTSLMQSAAKWVDAPVTVMLMKLILSSWKGPGISLDSADVITHQFVKDAADRQVIKIGSGHNDQGSVMWNEVCSGLLTQLCGKTSDCGG